MYLTISTIKYSKTFLTNIEIAFYVVVGKLIVDFCVIGKIFTI